MAKAKRRGLQSNQSDIDRKRKTEDAIKQSVEMETNPAEEHLPNDVDLVRSAGELLGEAISTSTDSDLEEVSNIKVNELKDLNKAVTEATQAKMLFDAQRVRAEKAAERYESLSKEQQHLLDHNRNLKEQIENKIETEKASITNEKRDLGELQKNNASQIEQLRELRLNSLSDFADEKLKRLADLENDSIQKIQGLIKSTKEQSEGLIHACQSIQDFTRINFENLSNNQSVLTETLTTQIRALTQKWQKDHTEFWNTFALDHQNHLDSLLEYQNELLIDLVNKRNEALRDKSKYEIALQVLEEDRDDFSNRVKLAAAATIEKLNGEIDGLREQLASSRNARTQLQKQLAVKEELDSKFGHRTREEILEYIKDLEDEINELNEKLKKRLDEKDKQRLDYLEKLTSELETRNGSLLNEKQSLLAKLTAMSIPVIEMEALRDKNVALAAINSSLRSDNEDLVNRIKDNIDSKKAETVFPQCARRDKTMGTPERELWTPKNLKSFVNELRHRIVQVMNDESTTDGSEEEKIKLYYEIEDIRSFVAGMSMSHLHLLEGISGTGKTSLPLAFAKAVNAGHCLIPIQAGWRDKMDLLGHYNSFEGKYYEERFFIALYEALCPLYNDRPYIVVLDEMNLSHPEQYFASILSALETNIPDERNIELMNDSVGDKPRYFNSDGKSIPLPRNIWFVGTANNDETTMAFADKTYDRAHVMELPKQHTGFDIKYGDDWGTLSFDGLEQLFKKARQDQKSSGSRVWTEFFEDKKIKDILNECFKIGWGNRLEKQIKSYVPIVVASGGTEREAADYLMASKVIRKIRDRHNNIKEDLENLYEIVEEKLNALESPKSTETITFRSTEIIADELKKFRKRGVD